MRNDTTIITITDNPEEAEQTIDKISIYQKKHRMIKNLIILTNKTKNKDTILKKIIEKQNTTIQLLTQPKTDLREAIINATLINPNPNTIITRANNLPKQTEILQAIKKIRKTNRYETNNLLAYKKNKETTHL